MPISVTLPVIFGLLGVGCAVAASPVTIPPTTAPPAPPPTAPTSRVLVVKYIDNTGYLVAEDDDHFFQFELTVYE